MRITQITPKFSTVIILLILFWIAYKVVTDIGQERPVMLYLAMGLSILIMLPYIITKIGLFPLFCGLVFMYWIPIRAGLWRLSLALSNVYPTEFGMWMLCIGILIHGCVSQSTQWNYTVSRFPALPFSLFIGGALITYLISENLSPYSDELARIRTSCFLPAAICFLCIYVIKTLKHAEHLLWIFLVSAGVFGLIFLYIPLLGITQGISYFGVEYGRISIMIVLPLLGSMIFYSGDVGTLFAFIAALSFNLWLNHHSFLGRSVAAGILAISGSVIVQGQGRGGLIAAGCAMVVITVLTLILRKHSLRLFSKGLLKVGITIALLLGTTWHYASISTIKSFQFRGMSLFTNPLHAYGLSDRINLWKEAFNVFVHHPFGAGIYGPPYGSSYFAHNLTIYLLLCFGVIGFIGFFWIFVRYSKTLWFNLRSDNLNRQILCIGGLGIATVLLVGGIFSPIMWDPWSVEMVWIPVGITMAGATLKDERAKGK